MDVPAQPGHLEPPLRQAENALEHRTPTIDRVRGVPRARPGVAQGLLHAVDAREDVLAGDRQLRGRLFLPFPSKSFHFGVPEILVNPCKSL